MSKILVCNHKMFLTYDEAVNLKDKMNQLDFGCIELIVCPSYLNMNVFSDYSLGAQNCFYEDTGAFTGEVSPRSLSLLGVKYCLVGHSERRRYDTNKEVNLKVGAILRNMMTPIVCVGETKMDKELMRTSEVLKKQLYSAIDGIKMQENEELIIAYEPVWSVGSGNNLSKQEIEDTLTYIRKLLKQKNIDNYKLLYGGSVNKDNIKSILSDKVDGYLLGNASVSYEELKSIIKCINGVNKDKN